MRKAGAFILLGVFVGACAVGDEDGAPVPPGESDDRDDILGILCNAEYTVTGSFTAGLPARPADAPTGCWPVGTWTFTASQMTNECETPPVQLATEYSFRVDRQDLGEGWEETYTYLGDTSKTYRLKVSEGGGGECEGGLELYNATGTEYWNLKPALEGTTLSGFAEYAKYGSDQRDPI